MPKVSKERVALEVSRATLKSLEKEAKESNLSVVLLIAGILEEYTQTAMPKRVNKSAQLKKHSALAPAPLDKLLPAGADPFVPIKEHCFEDTDALNFDRIHARILRGSKHLGNYI